MKEGLGVAAGAGGAGEEKNRRRKVGEVVRAALEELFQGWVPEEVDGGVEGAEIVDEDASGLVKLGVLGNRH